jgi:hypothetical protein
MTSSTVLRSIASPYTMALPGDWDFVRRISATVQRIPTENRQLPKAIFEDLAASIDERLPEIMYTLLRMLELPIRTPL